MIRKKEYIIIINKKQERKYLKTLWVGGRLQLGGIILGIFIFALYLNFCFYIKKKKWRLIKLYKYTIEQQ